MSAAALKSRVMQLAGQVEVTQDAAFDGLLQHYNAIREYAKKQHSEFLDFLGKTRTFCYATIAMSESFSQFFRSSSFDRAQQSPRRRPACCSLRRAADGFGMMIEQVSATQPDILRFFEIFRDVLRCSEPIRTVALR
eukprot:SAG31_NODE_7609_length_1642_cov_1.185353_1_plen_137_part_00